MGQEHRAEIVFDAAGISLEGKLFDCMVVPAPALEQAEPVEGSSIGMPSKLMTERLDKLLINT
jgi:hypothetical protein